MTAVARTLKEERKKKETVVNAIGADRTVMREPGSRRGKRPQTEVVIGVARGVGRAARRARDREWREAGVVFMACGD